MTIEQIHHRLGYCWRSRKPVGGEFWRFEFLNAMTNKFTA